ncbi:response regulator [Aliidiomarina celeris]|uniref:response regulator n=1 Tax=Aliidiomarina celeris TaxID=2249428 RepID=UPI001E62CD19|nr:response regulator [Aliidiomarina celeris]
MMQRVWIADDELEISNLLRDYLTHAGFACSCFTRGDTLLADLETSTEPPSIVLLDIMMPGLDGLEVCRKIRERSKVPILFISAKSDELDRVLGLKLGADDYLVKPFSPREVVARVESMLRRASWYEQPHSDNVRLVIQADAMQVSWNNQVVPLTVLEFKLLQTFAERPLRVFSREELMNKAYPDHRVVSDRTVDSHIKNVRAKLNAVAPNVEFIESVYGAGYRFVYQNSTVSP